MLRSSLAAAAARSPVAASLRRMLHAVGGPGGEAEAESVAYRMSMLRAPPVLRKKGLTGNSCSLIGRLDAPVRPYERCSDENPAAYTFLSVPTSSSPSDFRVTLQLKGELANVSLKHLKHNDLVYVSGLLASYQRVRANGERYIFYKICVTELNYVLDQTQKSRNDKDLADSSSVQPVTSQMLEENKCIDRLRLWQVFFASPSEWWDNRHSKPYINCPDFKHKDTREKLWLRPDDPPWVRKQLELHDLGIAGNGPKNDGRRFKNHIWKFQDFDYYSDDDEVQQSAEA